MEISKGVEAAEMAPPDDGPSSIEYWCSLIDEQEAARFLNLSARHMQNLRYRGDGPRFIRLSARCIRYRRKDLWDWAGDHLRTNTSDRGTNSR